YATKIMMEGVYIIIKHGALSPRNIHATTNTEWGFYQQHLLQLILASIFITDSWHDPIIKVRSLKGLSLGLTGWHKLSWFGSLSFLKIEGKHLQNLGADKRQ
ncbi:hypothetical protein ACJX0J_039572, partial [Zea mays]